jgi:hypothetical protein
MLFHTCTVSPGFIQKVTQLVITVVMGSDVVLTRIDVLDIALVPEKEQDKKKG